jgi:hypothetical protein
VIALGPGAARVSAREVVALRALSGYSHRRVAGVELMVFSNNNKAPTLDIHQLDQPLAEWLRRTFHERRRGFGALVAAHRSVKVLGAVALARNAFHEPERIVTTCARYLAGPFADHGVTRPQTGDLATLCFSYCTEVLAMDDKDLAEIKVTAERVAVVLSRAESAGALMAFQSYQRDQKRLRTWLQRQAIDWALRPPDGQSGPLVTTRGFELLFDPGVGSQSWFHRQLLLIAVLEHLHRLGWRPADAQDVVEKLRTEATDELPDDERAQLYETDEENR